MGSDRLHRSIAALFICILMILSLLLSSCTETDKAEPKEYYAYYLNMDDDDIGAVSVGRTEPTGEEMLGYLYESPKGRKNLKPILGSVVSTNRVTFSERQALLDFDTSYMKLTRAQEVLFRASVVRSLCQCSDVEFVSFEIDGKPLADSKGKLVGPMNNETFIYNVGNEINAYSKTMLTLYFANEAGNALLREEMETVYLSNISIETLVMQKLIEGPAADDKNALPTLPADTKLISISVQDGICYVSLDSEAAMSPSNITEEVALYSIVDSLTEIPGITKVQISINGEVDRNFRDKLPLGHIYERNMEIVEGKEV